MTTSLFFRLHQLGEAKFTAFQRELLMLTLEANPGVSLGVALADVFDYLEEPVGETRLEAIAQRLVGENASRESGPAEPPKTKGSSFGKSLVEWISGLHASERLIVATGYDLAAARRIYCEEDYLATDTLCSTLVQDRWNAALVHLEAAAAPWSGGNGSKQADEYYDMSAAEDDDPQWAALAAMLGGG